VYAKFCLAGFNYRSGKIFRHFLSRIQLFGLFRPTASNLVLRPFLPCLKAQKSKLLVRYCLGKFTSLLL